jgi:hypothetical protein
MNIFGGGSSYIYVIAKHLPTDKIIVFDDEDASF